LRGIVLTANLADPTHVNQVLRLLHQLRDLQSDLPVEIFYAGANEAPSAATDQIMAVQLRRGPPRVADLFLALRASLGPTIPATCFPDLSSLPGERQPFTFFKPLAIAASSFDEVMFLDANLLLFGRPDALFTLPAFRRTGLYLFRDYWTTVPSDQVGRTASRT
jgi:hypothetical protein